MADEVEVVDIGHALFLLHQVKVDALFHEEFANRLFLLLGGPPVDEVVERGIFAEDVDPCVVNHALLRQEPSFGVVDRNPRAADVDFAVLCRNDIFFRGRRIGRRIVTRPVRARCCFVVGIEAVGDLDRAVPVGIGEQPRHVAEIHHHEEALAVLFAQAGAAPDDLLELRHGADHLVEDDQLRHLAVRARGKQLRRRRDDRIRRGHGNEVVELALAVGVGAGDAHDVVGVFPDHVGVEVVQLDAHAFGMFFRGAEHDGLLHPAGALQVIGDFLRDLVRTVFEDDVVVEVAVGVDAVFDFVPELVELALEGTPAVRDVGLDVDHLERRQETVVDSLAQAVGVDRLAEVVDVGDVFGLLRRRGHADLRGRREIVEDSAPVAVLLRGSPVALVNDDEIEEIPAEELREPCDRFLAVPLILGILVARKLLVEGKVHFMRSDGDGVILGEVDLVDRLFKR